MCVRVCVSDADCRLNACICLHLCVCVELNNVNVPLHGIIVFSI